MKLNRVETNDITQFSDLNELCVALVGKYLKYKGHNYCLCLRGVTCFVNTWGDCEIEIPNHFPFKYTDDNGEHVIDSDTNKLNVKGISNFFFTINDK